jgi:hypothetical protein
MGESFYYVGEEKIIKIKSSSQQPVRAAPGE